MKEDPLWRNLRIEYSGHAVPGEGEHKIMQWIRDARASPSYEANIRHCMYGQDADLIMLALATHEPHFTLLREVSFQMKVEWIQAGAKWKGTSALWQPKPNSTPHTMPLDSLVHDHAVYLLQVVDFGRGRTNGRGAARAVIKQTKDATFQLLHISLLREYLEYEFLRYGDSGANRCIQELAYW